MHPDDVALVDLVTGQPVTPQVASHVATCPQCADELAALNDVLGLVREPAPELLPVPQRVWDAVAAGIDAQERPATATGGGTDTVGGTVTPPGADTDSVGGTASDELAARRARRGRRGRGRVAVGWVVGAAAAGLVLGGVGARLLEGEDPPPAGVTVASTSLATLDTGETMGSADVVRHDGRVDLDVRTGPMDPEGGYLEVWLINRDLERMVSVGVLQPGEADQSFTIPQELLDQGYVIVDISREGFDDKPEHSGDSIVRGDLAT